MQKARCHTKNGAPTACRQTGSGTISILYSRCFSPFPHGTGSLSVSREYLALRDGPRGFIQDFTCPALLRIPLDLVTNSCTGLSPSMIILSRIFHFSNFMPQRGPTTPILPKQYWFGLMRVRSPLLTQSLLFSSPMGTQMFQFPTFASQIHGMTGLQPDGLPHSDILGSMVICTYPKLFAAYHVLHRLREPRHPPSALTYFLYTYIKLLIHWMQ